MRALRFTEFGDPSVLHVAELSDPQASPHEAVVRVEAASINPSDVKNVAGQMDWTVLPRIPGRDFAGVVVGGPPEWQGVEVWGTGGDVGFTRDGSHAELINVPVAALARKPEALGFDEAAAVGVNFVTAWSGAVETAQLTEGETVAVFGVSGGVGGAVAQLGRALGARVIGVGRRKPDPATPAAGAIDEYVVLGPDTPGEIRRLTDGRGADVVYDAVGGVTTNAALGSLARRGRLVVISATGTRTVDIDIRNLYRNETRILGVDSGKLNVTGSAEILRKMLPYFESGAFKPLPITAYYPLSEGEKAYAAVAVNTAGRVVIHPGKA
ncbi:zinc-binding alcohol dehydrogenase family protein [Mycobacterium sherrisii]|uniref:Alcohol dehydrogenase n=1 Tax=Mycobacterium sherrisii TaxID=243061 RepID=A0A1E3SFR7_9MYCO|nr:zinc-binding alcohol dehydrogenase family protein [Mycobacterium sherrisii]MEC4765310.1 zinc-binding alcohol dehydrogenase family protein [Mycobacterium sherrisii]ODR01006.1 alcohol dehydrogenase [Mycobacterium sherrisii]